MGPIGIVLFMLAAVIVSAVIVRAVPRAVPTPLVQIALGAAIAAVSDQEVPLDPEVFFLLLLPPLLFLDGWRIPTGELLRDKGMILELALGLVFFTVIGMGLFIHWMIPAMPYPVAFALAAIVSPTDPVAVSAITARVPVPPRIMHVLEGESLLNDATGLVCFRFAVAAALTGSFALSSAALAFVQLAFVGVVVGVAMTAGLMWSKIWVSRRLGEDTGSHVLLSLLIPFIVYEAAEHLGGSGILAAVAAGLTMGYVELSGSALAGTRVQRTAVWDTVQFALNGVMFVLLGEQLPAILIDAADAVRESNKSELWWLVVYVLAINVALACLRFAWVWVSLRLSGLKSSGTGAPGKNPPWRLVAAMSFAGVRGAITLAGVLTLPLLADGTPFPARELAIFLAAGVIIVSLLTASIALPRLLQALAPMPMPGEAEAVERARQAAAEAAIPAVEAALHELASGQKDADVYADAAARVMEVYRRRLEGRTTVEDAERIRQGDGIERRLRLTGLRAERDALFSLARARHLSDADSRRLVRELDLLEERFR
ncbi:MAG TPA: Na+/H+ antiporter [Woeseiaceae bacterium]|nr:Na+/H+ antiporter [Woeseiaceae bacterium]